MKAKTIIAATLLAVSGAATAADSAGFTGWIETIHRADVDHDGMITPTEIAMYDPQAHEAGFRPFMIDHFAAWDFNHDMMVDMDEIRKGMDVARMTDRDMERAFFESVGFQPPRSQ
jgi:hypothetical protein